MESKTLDEGTTVIDFVPWNSGKNILSIYFSHVTACWGNVYIPINVSPLPVHAVVFQAATPSWCVARLLIQFLLLLCVFSLYLETNIKSPNKSASSFGIPCFQCAGITAACHGLGLCGDNFPEAHSEMLVRTIAQAYWSMFLAP